MSAMIDADVVSRYLSVLTGGRFRQGAVGGYPIPEERVKWFLWSTYDRGVAAMPYVHVAWMGVDETLHMETERLGNTSDTTEWVYGEKALYEFVKMDLTGFDREEVRAEYAKKFPIVVRRLETYKRLAAKESVKSGVQMELLFHGGKGLADFRLRASFWTSKMDTSRTLHEIDRNIAALRKVYYEIAERQKNLYFIYALPANRTGTPEETLDWERRP
jgi:hypothetical protein